MLSGLRTSCSALLAMLGSRHAQAAAIHAVPSCPAAGSPLAFAAPTCRVGAEWAITTISALSIHSQRAPSCGLNNHKNCDDHSISCRGLLEIARVFKHCYDKVCSHTLRLPQLRT